MSGSNTSTSSPLTSNPLTIGIHFDLICPWCLIGKRQLTLARDRFEQQRPDVAVETVWKPVQLLPDIPEQGLPFAEFYERRLGSPDAVRMRQEQVTQAARNVGLDLDLTRIERMPNTARAHRLLLRVEALGVPALYESLLERLFAAYFQRGQDIGDASTLRALAHETGVPADLCADATPDEAWPRDVVAFNGVPYFVFNGRLSVSGAQDAATLLAAMHRAIQWPALTDPTHA
ncbi:DsbA family oxidoreductase [Lysobacter niastensis]|uniref:DsbA family oxidoreductase n=1 Tax=Lysobacter niastensis TaxID=380629 RepID=UPI00361E58BE